MLEHMFQPLCEYHELSSVKVVGCEILRCDTMSLQHDMWYAIRGYVEICVRRKFPTNCGNSYLARASPKSANPPGQIGLVQKELPLLLLGMVVGSFK